MLHSLLPTSVLALGLLVACGSEQHPAAPYYGLPASTLGATKDNGSDAVAGKSGDSRSAAPDAGGKDPGTMDGPAPAPTDGSPVDEAVQLVEDCGGLDATTGAGAAEDLVNENLRGVPVVSKGKKKIFGPIMQDYSITATPTLALRSTSETSVANLTVAATATPTNAGDDAQAAAKKASGIVTTEMLPLKGRAAALAGTKSWDNIVCTVQPAKKLTVQTGGGNVVVQFDPPLPVALSPRALPARFEAELPRDRQFTGITATVTASDNAKVPAGSALAGVVTLRKLPLSASIALPDGTAANVAGDVAYEIAIDFGGPDVTLALGLYPSTKFYLDARLHRFSAVVTDTQMPTAEGAPAQTVLLAP